MAPPKAARAQPAPTHMSIARFFKRPAEPTPGAHGSAPCPAPAPAPPAPAPAPAPSALGQAAALPVCEQRPAKLARTEMPGPSDNASAPLPPPDWERPSPEAMAKAPTPETPPPIETAGGPGGPSGPSGPGGPGAAAHPRGAQAAVAEAASPVVDPVPAVAVDPTTAAFEELSAATEAGPLADSPPAPAEQSEPAAPAARPAPAAARGRRARAPAAPAAPLAPPEPECAYEVERAERIARNRAVMASLGILDGLPAPLALAPAAAAARPPRARAPKPPPPPPRASLRRSTRSGAGAGGGRGAGAAGGSGSGGEEEEEEEEAVIDYDDSSVRKYTIQVGSWEPGQEEQEAGPSGAAGRTPSGFSARPGLWRDALPGGKFYTLDMQGGLLAAAGHNGRVAVFGCAAAAAAAGNADGAGPEAAPPLLAWRGHGGWVSSVQFVSAQPQQQPQQRLLLTASNDRAIKLWDLHQTQAAASGGASSGGAGAEPREVSSLPGRGRAGAPALHAGGIFAMHERGLRILTAGKDGLVALAEVGPAGLAALRTFEGLHDKVVKCVRARDRHVFASCGQDGRAAVVDARAPAGAAAVIERAHGGGPVNCVDWRPSPGEDSPVLLTAGYDGIVRLHDLRAPAAPLLSLAGHSGLPAGARGRSICYAAFVGAGAGVATGGERSERLSLYCAASGRALSRGHIGYEPTRIYSPGGGNELLVSRGGEVSAFRLTWAAAPGP